MPISSLYQETVSSFIHQTDVHSSMRKKAKKIGIEISKSNNVSFRHSIPALQSLAKKIMKKYPDFGGCVISLEARITCADGTIPLVADAILCGHSLYNTPFLVILELKEWSDDFASLPTNLDDIHRGLIQTKYKDGDKDTGLRVHPSKQVSDYRWHPCFSGKDRNHIRGVAYCFKCKRGTETFRTLYYKGSHSDSFDVGYEEYIKDCRVYTHETVNSLINYLSPILAKGQGDTAMEIFNL